MFTKSTVHLLSLFLIVFSNSVLSDTKTGPIGGTGGYQFEDNLGYYERICGLNIRHSSTRIYAIQLEACDSWGNRSWKTQHGSNSGKLSYLPLSADDELRGINLTKLPINGASRIVGISIATKKAPYYKSFGLVGIALDDDRVSDFGSYYEQIDLPKGYEIHGIYGRSANELDALGIKYRKIPGNYQNGDSGSFGAVGGGEKSHIFSDYTQRNSPSFEKICGFRVRHGNRIDAIQIKVCDISGKYHYQQMHGGAGGTLSSFNLRDNEHLVAIKGWIGKRNETTRIFGMQFVTNAGRTSPIYGKSTSIPFELHVPNDYHIDGIFGAAIAELDAIGVTFSLLNN